MATIVRGTIVHQAALPQRAEGTWQQQQPDELRLQQYSHILAKIPTKALAGQQRAHAIGLRGFQQPRQQHEHALGSQQQQGYSGYEFIHARH